MRGVLGRAGASRRRRLAVWEPGARLGLGAQGARLWAWQAGWGAGPRVGARLKGAQAGPRGDLGHARGLGQGKAGEGSGPRGIQLGRVCAVQGRKGGRWADAAAHATGPGRGAR